MKLFVLAEEVINELQGISFDARVWMPIISNYIKLSRSKPRYFSFRKEIVIDGKEYPKEYNAFPIDYIRFTIDPRYGNGAGYDEAKSGYGKDNKYYAYFIFGDEAGYSSINHELKHAFEDFKKISKGYQGIKQSKERINLFSGDFERLMISPHDRTSLAPITTILEGLYYTSKLERSAYSDNVYDYPIYADILNTISSTIQYCNVQYIFNKYNPKILEEKWKTYKERYHIPVTDKFKNYEDFIKWACDEVSYKGNITLKKLRKVKYLGQQSKKEGSI